MIHIGDFVIATPDDGIGMHRGVVVVISDVLLVREANANSIRNYRCNKDAQVIADANLSNTDLAFATEIRKSRRLVSKDADTRGCC
jgi:hypothetical protein